MDHHIPRVNGGPDHPANLQAVHYGCNAGKRDRVVNEPTSRKW